MSSDDEWSDSDDDAVLPEVETSVLLGVPDGPVHVPSDVNDAAVSRIGGYPAFLPSSEPSFSASYCKKCSQPMELLVQMWCPFEDSPMDRALYIWGCSRTGCQRAEGSVRAWRGLRYNDKYAAKLEKKSARKKAKEKAQASTIAEAEVKRNASKTNPFSMNTASPSTPNPFGSDIQIFGSASSPPMAPILSEARVEDDDPVSDAESESASSEKSLLTAMASTTIVDSPWSSGPSYPPLYLSTASEYLSPPPKPKLPPGAHVTDPLEGGKVDNDMAWTSEAYENSMEIDNVFERFTKRVEYESEQCIRYDLKGTPLPFLSDKVFDKLFPTPYSPPLPVTKPDFKVVRELRRTFSLSAIPSCPCCGSGRVFECQLMPNLINVLKFNDVKKEDKMTNEERRKAVEKSLKGGDADEKRGMEWGTCMIFSCEQDCCLNDAGGSAKECWREEAVLVQWDV